MTPLLFVIAMATSYDPPVAYFCAAYCIIVVCIWTFIVRSISFVCFIPAFTVYTVKFVIFRVIQTLHNAVELLAGGIAEVCTEGGANVSKA